ncbi:DNA polymerase III subunit delta [Aliivibrio sp. S4TY2]|uniref:DNA polymerase III subunit delta n=1 Tax=unclassified Aliivibrio TaxID=2645654 RepID=UPI002378A33A|nr:MULTISPECIES: DNA polymerase III subunit delta [unclassified Aliivibrio]MDD9157061.1 DNA polymerase III subunit delta [Aliivibrio sp. S4TY2]MDD9161106.1 DNA polymerase III subunit delta [Aliivibrio sp. S4TY1]MDD9164973.1 DNA polymerase III subunit delta [Aliivibrio sp. S4MY2]MDD9169134.1 DNA polymerase III subunit delta [Aliivibrio sp. S4MY4]MDD9185862.1 DNA polymerase III subunit delta [Aliivibrio sp. S4MY3]
MRVFPEQLVQNLERGLRQSYLLFGNEPLLKQESLDAIRQAAIKQGFEEKHQFTLDKQLDWELIFDCTQALSLFSSRQILELTIPDTGLTTAHTNKIKELVPALHDDILLIFQGPRVNKAQENTQWFKALTQLGLFVPCNTPDNQQLPRFIQQRCKTLKLKPDAEAVQMLAQWHEGNLLALAQSLDKLALLYPDGLLTLIRIEEALNRNNHFTPFQLVDTLLPGQAKRAQRILRQLESEGMEVVILLRTLQKELFLLQNFQQAITQGEAMFTVFDRYKVWQNRRSLYQSALQRLPMPQIQQLIRSLALMEVATKTDFDTNCWPQLSQLTLDMCNIHISVTPNLSH